MNNKIVNNFLPAGDKFMSEIYLRYIVLVGHSLKIKKE